MCLFSPISLIQRGATIHTTESADLDADHVISVHRTLDKRMLQLNKEGFLNGHTPFSALVAFSTVIAARMAAVGRDLLISHFHFTLIY